MQANPDLLAIRLAREIDRLSSLADPYFSELLRVALLQVHEPSAHKLAHILAPGADFQIAIEGRRTHVRATEGSTVLVFDVGPAPMHRARAIIAGAIALRQRTT